MTTIVYHQETLYADRCHVRVGTPMDTFAATKIHTSADKQFAYGVSGRSIKEPEHPAIEALLRSGLEKLMTVDMGDQTDTIKVFTEEQRERLADFGNWVVMLKHRCFMIFYRTTREATGATMGVGTGFWFVTGMIAGGMSPEKALSSIEDLDPYTGKGVDKIAAKSLKPFIIGGGQ